MRKWGMLSNRRALLILSGIVGLAAGIAVAAWAATRAEAPVATETPAASAAPSPSATLSGSVPAPSLRLGEIIATTAVDELEVFDAPDGSVTDTLGEWSLATFQPLTLLAIEEQVVADVRWLHVLIPAQPNQSTGWIRAEDVTLSSTDITINIYVAEHELELLDGDRVLLTASVAVGTDATPTPPGIYSVTDPLDSTHNDTGVYGAFALGLSGFSEVLETFNGAPPQLAIHGTNEPDLIGQSVSNGCIRLTNPDVLTVVEHAGLGTPVIIHASRADLTVAF
jgi:hypothetical protein